MKKNKLFYLNFLLIAVIFITQFGKCNVFDFWKFIASSMIITYTLKEIINVYNENNGYIIPKESEFNFRFATFSFASLSYLALFILLPFSFSNLLMFMSMIDLKNILIAFCSFLFLALIYSLILYYLIQDEPIENN